MLPRAVGEPQRSRRAPEETPSSQPQAADAPQLQAAAEPQTAESRQSPRGPTSLTSRSVEAAQVPDGSPQRRRPPCLTAEPTRSEIPQESALGSLAYS